MSVEAYFRNVVLSGYEDYNWARLSFDWARLSFAWHSCQADVEVRVPKQLQSIEEIKAHALSRAREFFQLCAAADYSE
jgi:hypothetical protein